LCGHRTDTLLSASRATGIFKVESTSLSQAFSLRRKNRRVRRWRIDLGGEFDMFFDSGEMGFTQLLLRYTGSPLF
jgi:hypothetical protein